MLIEAQGLAVGFDTCTVLENISFAARSGEMIGLIGPNGAGKTSLLHALAGLKVPRAGTVRYDGSTAAEIGTRALGRRIAFLAQGDTVHWELRAEAVAALGRLPHRQPFRGMTADDHAAIERALKVTDTIALRHRTLMQLSGGERMRVLLARALAVEAEMLLADEPIASLDPQHQLDMMALMRDSARSGRGVIVVLHDLTLASRFCDRLVLLAKGRILADGAPETVLTDAHLATAYDIQAIRGTHDGSLYILPWATSKFQKQCS